MRGVVFSGSSFPTHEQRRSLYNRTRVKTETSTML
jgi:hypothetical protein